MSLTDLISKKVKSSVGTVADGILEFDATISETYIDEAETTDYPIEGGADNTDHFRKLPAGIEINGMVTNTPLVYLASTFAKSPVSTDHKHSNDRVEVAYSHLRKLQDEGTLVDVVSSLREYKNMALNTISAFRDAANGNVLNFTLGLREITIAGTLTTDLPLPLDSANKAAKNQGKKDKKPGTDGQDTKSQSTLSRGVEGLRSAF